MALYIVSGRQKKITLWLKKICPCYTYSFADKEKIEVGGETKKYAKLIVSKNIDQEEFCPCYCDHPAGCNLIFDIVKNTQSIYVNDDPALGTGSNYNPNTKTVEINPNQKHKKIITEQNKKTKKSSSKKRSPKNYNQFAHELIHALDDLNGKVNIDDGDLQEETNAIQGTNQIRKENGLDYHRTHHGDTKIDNPTKPYLDVSDLFKCECKEKKK